MGAGVSKQQIGERVKSAKRKLEETSAADEEQYQRMCKQSPETLSNMVTSIEKALQSCSPFPETLLSLAFRADGERVKKALTACTEKVLAAPIQKEQYQWFMQYVFKSSVWFRKTESGEYLYRELMKITDLKQEKIIKNMDAVFDHLESHSKWYEIKSIQNQKVMERQDDDAVGLLKESGIRDILDLKESDDESNGIEQLKNFVDNNLAVNILMTTAKAINNEFQREMGTILNRHGDFKPGPMKKVERALSKMENDYMNEEYPKAAKLLDIVRCSASYNTISQLLDGYNAFMSHIESGVSSMALARVKNGFLEQNHSGYRDIKVNVVYHSTLDPNLKMICEVQFILNQYLYEKKRVHKLYSIAREQTYFDMVALEEHELEQQHRLKAMKFEPILNVRKDVQSISGNKFFKSSIDSDLGLLGMNGGDTIDSDTFFCVNMDSKQLVFNHSAFGRYSHHWITINDQKYLSLQTTPNTINMFAVSDDHQFEEDESMKITLGDDDVINFYEYDKTFEHIIYVRNRSILEKRAVSDNGTVLMSIELENPIGNSVSKLLSLSNDGKFCAIAAAGNVLTSSGQSMGSNFFYLIAMETQEQYKMTTQNLTKTHAPCFINGDSKLVTVGGYEGEGVEIWSVEDKEMVHHIPHEGYNFIASSYSANGILAVGDAGCYLRLYDVTSWNEIYKHQFVMIPRYLFLTEDMKYVAAGGTSHWTNGEQSVIMKIE